MSGYLVTPIQVNENIRHKENQNRNIVYFQGKSILDTTQSASRLQAPLKIPMQHRMFETIFQCIRVTPEDKPHKEKIFFFQWLYLTEISIAMSQKFTNICRILIFGAGSVQLSLNLVKKMTIQYFCDYPELCIVPQCTI